MFDHPSAAASALGPSSVTRWLTQPFEDQAARVLTTRESQSALVLRSWTYRHALLATLDHNRTLDGAEAELRQDFQTLRVAPFLSKWCRRRPKGLASVLERLGPSHAPGPGAYVALFDILEEDGVGAQTLRHSAAVAFDRILQFANVPDWMRTKELPEPNELPLWTARSLGKLADRRVAEGAMTYAQAISDLPRGYFSAIEWAHYFGRPLMFPPPLWPGSARLRYVADVDVLKEAAKRFKNCAYGYCDDCLSGAKAVYLWEADEPAMVSVKQICGLMIVSEVAGVANKPVTYPTVSAILAELPDAAMGRSE